MECTVIYLDTGQVESQGEAQDLLTASRDCPKGCMLIMGHPPDRSGLWFRKGDEWASSPEFKLEDFTGTVEGIYELSPGLESEISVRGETCFSDGLLFSTSQPGKYLIEFRLKGVLWGSIYATITP